MAIQHELRDFEDVLNAQLVAAAVSTEIAWPNRTYVPKKGVSYLSAECAGRARTPLGFGIDAVQQWTGTYQVSVFVPRDTGTREQSVMASKLLRAFPRGLNLVLPAGSPLIVTASTTPAPVVFGDWSNQPVLVSWFATEP